MFKRKRKRKFGKKWSEKEKVRKKWEKSERLIGEGQHGLS
jgi:hypothetical protein